MWIESPGNALLGLADRVGCERQVITLIDRMYRRRKKPARSFPAVPHVEETLSALSKRYSLAVVSARDEDSTMGFLGQSGLLQYFQVIVTALSAPHTKPYPDPVQLAAKEMGVAPTSCLMIGDTTVDIRAGRSAGAQTVGVLCGFGEEAELRRQGADLILRSTADLAQALLDPS